MLFWLVIIPILIGVLLYLFPVGKAAALIAQIALLCCTFYVFLLSRDGEIISNIGGYNGLLGISLKADTLSSVFVMLTAMIFSIVAIYNYNEEYGSLFRFLFFVWEGLLIGIFLSGDMFNIFVLLEVATVVVSILIMFNRDNRSTYDGMVYLMVNTVAIQFYLFGVGYIYKLTGVLDLDAAAQRLALMDKSALVLPYALIITSVSLKCALMPLFSWLPKAHSTPGAPTTVSAILSGLHIKSSIYLFIRYQAVFQAIDLSVFFLYMGIVTGIAGFIFALSQTDIKLILAYHTISQIGMIMIGLNSEGAYSYTGGVYHIVNHALFKSALFLTAGIVIQTYKTRNIYQIRGVFRRVPPVGAAMVMAILGITGAPFFNGSISKYFITSGANLVTEGAILLINLGTIISFIKYSSMLFGKYEGDDAIVKIDKLKQISVAALGIICFIGGVFGSRLTELLFDVNVSVDIIGYLQKTALFFVSAGLGFVIYKFYVKDSRLLKRIRGVELGFKGICISIGMFFAVILLVAAL